MQSFLDLVLKIAFSHLYRDPKCPEASQLYDSFFPKKNDSMMINSDPMDPGTIEFRSKILNYMSNYVLCSELPTEKVENSERQSESVSIQE